MSPIQTTFGMKDGLTPLRFKLFGIGGAGCNVVSSTTFPSVAIGSSQKEVERCANSQRIVLLPEILEGLASTDASVLAPNMMPKEIVEAFFDTDIAVLIAGLGGETGSSGIRFLASASRIMSKPSISVVSLPFSVESINRREIAAEALSDLKKRTDMVISFTNDKLKKLVPNLPMDKVFKVMNAIMERPITDLSRIMIQSDVQMMRQIASGSDEFRLGVGLGRGINRDLDAIKEALDSPWFDFDIMSVESAFLVISSYPIDAKEVDATIKAVHSRISNAKLMFGSYEDPSLGDRLRVMLLVGRPASI
ncbi:MAG: hypothetical protein QXE18_05555 [Thermoplasmata archaeon]